MGVATLKLLLMRAYDSNDYQIVGPAWLQSNRYQIQAKLPAGVERTQVGLMLQSLRIERFGLAAQRESRQPAIYDLTVAKAGAQLRRSSAPDQSKADVPASPRFVKGADGLP